MASIKKSFKIFFWGVGAALISEYLYQAHESVQWITAAEWFMTFYGAPESQKVEDVQAWHFRKMSHHSLWIPVGFIILVLERRRLYIKADHLSVNMRNHSAFPQHGWGILVFWMLFSLWRADLEAGGCVRMFALKSTFKLEAHILCFPGLCWHKMWKSGFETNPRRSTLKKNKMWLITVWWSMALGHSAAVTCLSIHTLLDVFSINVSVNDLKLVQFDPVSRLNGVPREKPG